MDKKIQEHIRSLSNADLIQYLNVPPDTYLPEAVAFARQELDGRHLSAEQVSVAEQEVAAREVQKIETANAPLDPVWQCFTFITLLGVVWVLPVWLTFKRSGRQRMARDLLKWWLAGVIFWTIVNVLLRFFVKGYRIWGF
jgi:hypothetical protein